MPPTVVTWIVLPGAFTLLAFAFGVVSGRLAPASVVDSCMLLVLGILDFYPGIVHMLQHDTGLIGVAGMAPEVYKKHEAPLILFNTTFGSYQMAFGFVRIYVALLITELAFQCIVANGLFLILTTFVYQNFTANGMKAYRARKMLLPNAPNGKKTMLLSIIFVVYLMLRFFETAYKVLFSSSSSSSASA